MRYFLQTHISAMLTFTHERLNNLFVKWPWGLCSLGGLLGSLTWHINLHTNMRGFFCLIMYCYIFSTSLSNKNTAYSFLCKFHDEKKILNVLKNPLPAYEI